MFSTVTVPIDGSPAGDRAIPPAVRLARAVDAKLELVSLVAPHMDSTLERTALEERAGALDDISAEVRIIESLTFGRTLAEWGASDDRLLCLSTRGRGALGKALLGSVAGDVAHAAMTPFVMVGPDVDIDVDGSFSSIVGCVDGDEPMDVITDAIAALGLALAAFVSIVTVDRPGPVSFLPGPNDFDPVDRACEALLALHCYAHRRLLEEQDVAGAIAAFLRTQPTPLAVVGTHQRAKITRIARSSGALEIVQQSPVPVLVVPFGRAAQRRQGEQAGHSGEHTRT
jgi:nucleotide-binding universal stress UspA family protein